MGRVRHGGVCNPWVVHGLIRSSSVSDHWVVLIVVGGETWGAIRGSSVGHPQVDSEVISG